MIALLALLAACGGDPAPAPAPAPATAPVPAPRADVSIPHVAWRLPERLSVSPAAVPPTDEVAAARARLAEVVVAHARDPGNPWAIGHALVALGPDVVLTNDADAVDWLFSEYAYVVEIGGEPLIRFPTERDGARVEPHSELVLKALTEVGITPDRPVRVDGRDLTVGHLYRGALARAWVDGDETGFASWNDTPWALQALATWAPEDLAWTASGGHPMTMDTFTSAVVAKLREETAFMRRAMARGETVDKRGQGVFAYTCGGAHLYQGAAYAVARGFGTEADRAAMAEELDVYLWRVRVELTIVDQLLAQHPEYSVLLVEQRLKFLGHVLETAHRAFATELVVPTDAHRETLRIVREQLVATVNALDAIGVLDRLDEVRDTDEQVYLDIVGDAAHAVRGLDLDAGAAGVRW